MIDAFSTPRNRTRTFILLAFCGLLAISAGIIGINDNPVGILLAYLAATAFVLAFVHPWRTAKQFRRPLYASVIGLALFVILNNIFAAIAHSSTTACAIQKLLQGLAVVAFFLGTLIFPAALIISAVGLVAMFIRSHRQPT